MAVEQAGQERGARHVDVLVPVQPYANVGNEASSITTSPPAIGLPVPSKI
jgi:hypothetical protein